MADSLAMPPLLLVPLVSSRLRKLNNDKVGRLPLVELALTPGAWRAQRCFLLSRFGEGSLSFRGTERYSMSDLLVIYDH